MEKKPETASVLIRPTISELLERTAKLAVFLNLLAESCYVRLNPSIKKT